jgi:hypothetical protein
MKKIIGGTISHSHKSLRSGNSSRKRITSMDSAVQPDSNGMRGRSENSLNKYNNQGGV